MGMADQKNDQTAEESRPVPSQAEGDEETIDKSLEQKEQKK
jgi:hypothetical protein